MSTILQSLSGYWFELGLNPVVVEEQKNRDDLKLFTRPTIPWSLECELVDGYDRQYGIEQFSLTLGHYGEGTAKLKGTATIAYALIGFWAFGTMCCGSFPILCCGANGDPSAIGFAAIIQTCSRCSMIGLSFAVIGRLGTIKEVSNANIVALEGHVSVDCSDEWSIVRTETVMLEQEESLSDARTATFWVAAVLIWIAMECCCVFSAVSGLCKAANHMSLDNFCEEMSAFLKAYAIVN